MARFVLHPDALGQVDTRPLLRHLGEDVAGDMRRIVAVDEGDLLSTIRVDEPTRTAIAVRAGGQRGTATGKMVDYHLFVERGTSRMRAQPFIRPALYRYRAGR